MPDAVQCVGADLCDELRGSSDTSFTLTYEGDPPSRDLGGTPSFRILADLSPLCVGHLLVVPLEHRLSFSSLVVSHGDELSELLDRVLPRYRATFGQLAILEHGSSSEMETSACVTHAHWHLLPVPVHRINAFLVEDGLVPTRLDQISDLARYAGSSYFFCSDGSIGSVYGVGRKMRSQYLRSIAGRQLGIEDPLWDYSMVVRKEDLRTTMVRARGLTGPGVGSRQPKGL
ncbi:hypothetical protein [Cryptosporangium sp. NPDC051539]|uniref:hypothetical protein n=1 Tax=Cryptosporangium sp. NPDC051539 TaxID=3363962 RepID=UPI0037B46303